MPGNRAGYQDAIKKGHNFAWDGQWNRAIEEYRRALDEFPDDFSAHLSLAHVLEELGQLEGAVYECRVAAKLQPHDPVPLTHLARLQEKMGRLADAATTYSGLAEIYLARKAMGKAADAWQKVVALEPERWMAHQQLAQVYEQAAHNTLAAREYLTLARLYQKRGEQAKALEAAEKARALDPKSVPGERMEEQEGRAPRAEKISSPVDRAEQTALSRLADTLLGEQTSWAKSGTAGSGRGASALSQAEIDALIARAVDAQTRHRVADAISCYSQLLAGGVTRPEIKFNLGLLYSESMRYDDAITLLNGMVSDPQFALASHFELGKCYRALGKMDQAVEHFLQVTKIVDLGSVRREQADELILVYEGLLESYVAKGDSEQAEAFSRALEEFLTSKGWEDKVREVRAHLESLQEEGSQVSLAEVINAPGTAQMVESLGLAQELLRRGRTRAASEECFRALEVAPNYVPAHVRLAQILLKEGHVEEAKAKYQLLAELSLALGEPTQAEGFYRQLLKIVPNDAGGRSKLIDLAVQQGHLNVALEQYLELGDEFARRGHLPQAVEKFAEGIRLAERAGSADTQVIALRHRLAEARAKQGDFAGAFALYQEIRQQSPDDERASVYMIDLGLRLGQADLALATLEQLLTRYRERGQPRKVTALLEDLVRRYPNQLALRAQLADNYLAIGDQEKAIGVLDALGELQLNAGQKQAAMATIRQIIAMNPPQLDDYKQLLEQMGDNTS